MVRHALAAAIGFGGAVIGGALVGLPRDAGAARAIGPEAIAQTLDAFHDAASKADGDAYFGLMTEGGVFLGTDASERWDKAAFKRFAEPYFSQGRGWTYLPRDRHIAVSASGETAWFDELLDNASLGVCRGSGVLTRTKDGWRIEQYNLSIMVPNDLAKDVAKQIRELEAKTKQP